MRGLTVCELSARLQAGEMTSEALVMECLHCVETSPRPSAYVFMNAEGALAAARASDDRRKKGMTLGLLDGIPYALEDRFCTKDLPTENHCQMLSGYHPVYDAEIVDRLRSEGAILLGKLATDGFLAGAVCSENSSVIAETVAAGEIPFAICADTGGSGLCKNSVGVVSFRYTDRQISRNGLISVSPSFDGVSTVTQNVKDAKLLFDVLIHSTDLPLDLSQPISPNIVDLDVSCFPLDAARKSYRILSVVETASEMALYDGIRFGASVENQGSVEKRVSKTRGTFFSYDEKKTALLGTALLMDGRRESCYLPAREHREAVRKMFEELLEHADVLRISLSEQTAFLPSFVGLSALASDGTLLMTFAERSRMLLETGTVCGEEGGGVCD